MSKKYEAAVVIQTTASHHIGDISFDTIEEYNEKAQELWESQDYEYPTTNISNNFDLSDWDLCTIDEDNLKYLKVKK